MIRKANQKDLPFVGQVYDEIHDMEESGKQVIGWVRGVYPVEETAAAAIRRGDLYVMEEPGEGIIGAAIINQIQVDVYADAAWTHEVPDEKVCVLHTLVISPRAAGKGRAREFIRFYEAYAAARGWYELRIDTNSRNQKARAMYAKLGYREVGIVPALFNGIPGVDLVLLEKNLEAERA